MKMISLILLEEDVRIRILLLAKGVKGNAGPRPERLSLSERSLVTPIRNEIMTLLNTLFDITDRSELATGNFERPIQRALFQILPYDRNATANLLAIPLLEFAEASLLDTSELVEWASAYKWPEAGLVQILKNAGGVMLIGDEFPNYVDYYYRLHDLDRLILLAQIAEQMIRAEVTASSASGWLKALPPKLRDPYTGEKPMWEESELQFPDPGLDRESQDEPGLDLPLP